MFRKKTPGDVLDSDYIRYVKPHFDLMDKYLVECLIPDFCAFYIFSAYSHHCEQENYDTFIDCGLTYFEVALSVNDLKKLKKKVVEILKIKYGLFIKNYSPLELKNCFPELL